MSRKMMADIQTLQADIEGLKRYLAAINARLVELEKKRGPGRPKKENADGDIQSNG